MMRKSFFYVSIPLTIALIVLFLRTPDVDIQNAWQKIHNVNIFFFLLILIFTALNFYIAAFRWQFIINKFGLKTPSFFISYASISLSVLGGLFLPKEFATLSIRSLTLKLNKVGSFKSANYTILYDIGFNIYTVLFFIPSAILFFFVEENLFRISGFLLNIIFFYLIPILFLKAGLNYSRKILDNIPILDKLAMSQEDIDNAEKIISNYNTFTLLTLSLIQHTILAIRNYIIILALSIPISFVKILLAYPAVYLFTLIGLTPGGLGIQEFTWQGALVFQGIGTELASTYAIVNRLLIFFTQVSIGVIVLFSVLLLYYNFKKRGQINKII